MRRNLRLDWRALALLGALLSLIIAWPGLVYAMPTIFLPTAVITTNATQQQQQQQQQTVLITTNASVIATRRAASTATGGGGEGDVNKIYNLTKEQEVEVEHKDEIMKAAAVVNKRNSLELVNILKNNNNSNKNGSDSVQKLSNNRNISDSFLSDKNESQNHKNTSNNNNRENRRTVTNHRNVSDNQNNQRNSSVKPENLINFNNATKTETSQQQEKSITNLTKKQQQLNYYNNKNTTIISGKRISIETTTANNGTTTPTPIPITKTIKPMNMTHRTNPPTDVIPIDTTTLKTQASSQTAQRDANNVPLTTTITAPTMRSATVDSFLSLFTFSSSHHIAILSRTERSIRDIDASSSSSTSSSSAGADIVRRLSSAGGASSSSSSSSSLSVSVSGNKINKRLNSSRFTQQSQLHPKNNNNNKNNYNSNNNNQKYHNNSLDRNERSTISMMSGPSRKIQLYIKNRFLQLLPDGTVNGTQDDQSDYTILQRSTVDVGRIKIQGVATCLYLCMDQCGAAFGSKDFTDDCVFNENMEQHNYNTYSSTYNSNARRIYYLALNRHGELRKLQIPPTRSLGKLATYTNAITELVSQERVEQLIAKNFGANRIKHGIRQLCDTGKPLIELIDSKNFKARPECNPNNSVSNSNSSGISSGSSTSNTNSSSDSSSSISHSLGNNSRSSSSSSHRSDINSSNSSSDGQLQNVPVANDRFSSSSSSSSSSTSLSNSGSFNSSSSSSSSSNSPDSIINHPNNSGHINSSSSSNSSSSTISNHNRNASHLGLQSGLKNKRKRKRRKCRPHENEEEHNCQMPPLGMLRKGEIPMNTNNNSNNNKNKLTCKERQLKQKENGVPITPCGGPKRGPNIGPKKNGTINSKKAHNSGPRSNKSKNHNNNNNNKQNKNKINQHNCNDEATGPNNRRGKKLNNNGRQGGANKNKNTLNAARAGGAAVGPKKCAKTKTPKGGKPKQPSHPRSTTTTAIPPPLQLTTSAYESLDMRGESASDRGEREQRNVHISSSMQLETVEEEDEEQNEEIGSDEVDDEEEGEEHSKDNTHSENDKHNEDQVADADHEYETVDSAVQEHDLDTDAAETVGNEQHLHHDDDSYEYQDNPTLPVEHDHTGRVPLTAGARNLFHFGHFLL